MFSQVLLIKIPPTSQRANLADLVVGSMERGMCGFELKNVDAKQNNLVVEFLLHPDIIFSVNRNSMFFP